MAIEVTKVPEALVFALAAAHNKGQVEAVTTEFHADVTSLTDREDYRNPVATAATVTSANASTTPTAVALVNELLHKMNLHFADLLAHVAEDVAIDEAECTDEATAIALVNILSTAYNDHLVLGSGSDEYQIHYNDDETNTDGSSTASNAGTLYTRANNLKAKFNAHIASAPPGSMLHLVDP